MNRSFSTDCMAAWRSGRSIKCHLSHIVKGHDLSRKVEGAGDIGLLDRSAIIQKSKKLKHIFARAISDGALLFEDEKMMGIPVRNFVNLCRCAHASWLASTDALR